MIWLALLLILFAAALLIFCCLDALFQERGKIVERDLQRGVEFFDAEIEPRLGGGRENAHVGVVLWMQLTAAAVGAVLAAWTILYTPESAGDWAAAFLLLLVVITLAGMVSGWLIQRARLAWLSALAPAIRLALHLVMPLGLPISLVGHLARLGHRREPDNAEEKRESDIEALVEAGEEEGIIEADERELVQSALQFGDKRLREVMVPRPDIIALPATATFFELRELARQRPYQRLPVYDGDLDRVLGVVGARELLQIREADWGSETVGKHLGPVLFTPESATTFELLRQMQQRRIHVAIVINEYGGVAGLVTVSDLLEEIVGELPPETVGGAPAASVEQVPGQYVVLGSMDLDRVEDILGVRFERGEANTLGGLLVDHLGRIPHTGERVRLNGMDFEIMEANRVRVLKVRVVPA